MERENQRLPEEAVEVVRDGPDEGGVWISQERYEDIVQWIEALELFKVEEAATQDDLDEFENKLSNIARMTIGEEGDQLDAEGYVLETDPGCSFRCSRRPN